MAIDTTNPPGNEEKAAKFVAGKLRAAGIEPVIVPFAPGRANVVARLKGDGAQAAAASCSRTSTSSASPGSRGRRRRSPSPRATAGSTAAASPTTSRGRRWPLALVIELKRTHAPLHRDIILALTGDEESGGAGIRYILDHRKELLGDAEFALNEGGGVLLDGAGKARLVSLGTAEKTFQDFSFIAHGVGGHSSVPNDENAIYRLARALDKLAAFKFPTRLSPAVRDSLRAIGRHAAGGARQGHARRRRRQGRRPSRPSCWR